MFKNELTLSSFGALLSSFIRANTIGRDIVKPFIAAIFRGPIFSFIVASLNEELLYECICNYQGIILHI